MKKSLLNGILCAGALMVGMISANGQQWTGSTSTTGNISRTGNVGIGTATPQESFEIDGSKAVGGINRLKVGNAYFGETGNADGLDFNYKNFPGGTSYITKKGGAASLSYIFNSTDPNFGSLLFRTTGSAVLNAGGAIPNYIYPFIINKEGKVGLGINNFTPSAWLDVKGDCRISDKLVIGAPSTLPCKETLKLYVDGKIGATEVRVSTTTWCDYVFEPSYKLKPLAEVESFIQANKHLPEVPSEAEVVENGMAMGEMMKIHMKKIEELTLYMIELKKENEKLAAEVAQLKK